MTTVSPIEIFVEDIPTQTGYKIKKLAFKGQLDESNIDDKAKLIYQLIENEGPETHYIFHLSELEYMNSKAIGYFTDWYNRIIQANGQIFLAESPDNILDILDTVGLTSLIENHSTVQEATIAIVG